MLRTAVVALGIVLLSACDSSTGVDENGFTIRGSVTAPEGVDVAGTEVTACFGGDADPDPLLACDFSSSNTQALEIESTGTAAPFEFTNLAEGEYWLGATLRGADGWAVVTGSDCASDGQGNCQYFSTSTDNVEITMGPIQNDFRVRVTGPSGFDLTDGEVAFCIEDEQDPEVCDAEDSSPPYQLLPPRQPGGQFSVQIPSVPAGDYQILAGKDTDGDGVWDFWNCYFTAASSPRCAEVSPGSGLVYQIGIVETDRDPPFPYDQPLAASAEAAPRFTPHGASMVKKIRTARD